MAVGIQIVAALALPNEHVTLLESRENRTQDSYCQSISMEEEQQEMEVLHIVMFPWLAIGHLRPFFRLSKSLAQKGHKISFISTPKNLQTLPKIPPNLSCSINLVTLPMPKLQDLPENAESSMDVPHVKQQLLKVAYDLLGPLIRSFFEEAKPKPDWIVCDYASHWLPPMAAEFGISRAFFSLFTASFMAFLGRPSELVSPKSVWSIAESFTVVPPWIPFPSNMAFRRHEMTKNMEKDADGNQYDSGTSDTVRFALSIEGSDIVIFRSCVEFEPEWFELIGQLYANKPVIPIGVIPHSSEEEEDELGINKEWQEIKDWLDNQKAVSVVYVALGTETALSKEETEALALGLEQCNLPFFWVLNKSYDLLEMLPVGFCDRVKGRGMVYEKWAPQVKILSHDAVGGFLTHCGWNSVTEALGFGRVLILFPVMNDQGLNARLLDDKKVGVEIPRDEKDGSFTSDSVADSVRLAMVGEEGKMVRENARQMKQVFGDISRTDYYMDNLIQCMMQTRGVSSQTYTCKRI